MDRVNTKLQAGLQTMLSVEELVIQVKDDETDLGAANTGFIIEHPNEDNLDAWILDNFTKKTCAYYIATGHEGRCGCGYPKSTHQRLPIIRDEPWASQRHTEESSTNAYGTITFATQSTEEVTPLTPLTERIREAEFIRLSDTTSAERISILIREIWGVKLPKLLLSIVGGNKECSLSGDIISVLENALAKIIRSADTWVTTGGTHSGVNKTVARIFQAEYRRDRKFRNACIGVLPWGCVKGRKDLFCKGGKTTYTIMDEVNDDQLEIEEAYLDENHTHFLLVDDGSQCRFGIERKLNSKIEKFLTDSQDGRPIPGVVLLIEGGISSIRTVHTALDTSPQMPVVVMAHSGRAANVLAEVWAKHNEDGQNGLDLLNVIKINVAKYLDFDLLNPKNRKATDLIKEIIEDHSDQIIIYDPYEDPYGLQQAILQACKVTCAAHVEDKEVFSRLQLAILLDEMDMARKSIEENEYSNVAYLEKALFKALKRDKVDFVGFLLNYGINLDTLLTQEVLTKLYVKKIEEDSTMVKLMTTHEKDEFLRHRNEPNVETLQNCQTQQKYRMMFDLRTIDRIMEDLMFEDYTACYNTDYNESRSTELINPIQELIIWAVLNNMPLMAECLWKFDKENPLSNILIISRLYGALSRKDEFDPVVSQELDGSCQKFRDMALDVLSYCYHTDKDLAVGVVQLKVPLWGHKSVLTLAANGWCRKILAHNCCQAVLTTIWNGKTEELSWIEQLKRLKSTNSRSHITNTSTNGKITEKVSQSLGCIDTLEFKNIQKKKSCSQFGRDSLKLLNYLFYIPKGKMQIHVLIYLIFLGLFSHIVLVKPGPLHKLLRWVAFVIVTSLGIEEFRQLVDVRKDSNWMKFKQWASNIWNHLDAYSVILFYVGFAFSYYSREISHPIFAVSLVIFYVKLAKFFRQSNSLGPYLVMISRMIAHMTGFLLVLLLAIVSYGIFMHAFLFPNSTVAWKIIFQLLFRPYLLIFGEMGISSYELSRNATIFGTPKLDKRATEIIVIIAMAIYLLFANVILLNLLIAVFNNIYEDVKANADQIWKFEKYDMIMEFHRKPILPIPFSVIPNLWRIIKRLILGPCLSLGNTIHHDFIEVDWNLLDFRRRCMRGYCNEKGKEICGSLDENVRQIREKVDKTIKTLADLEDRLEERFGSMEKAWRRRTTHKQNHI